MRAVSALLLCLITSFTFAQETLVTGQITGSDQGFIPYAAITEANIVLAIADENGRFAIRGLSRQNHQLAIEVLGYEKHEVAVDLSQKAQVELGQVSLVPGAVQIGEVVITCPRNAFNYSSCGSNHIITPAQLRLTQPIATEEVLKTVPGINVVGDMGLSNRLNIGIRGAYPRRSGQVLILEDGTPVAPAPYLAPEAYYNPPTERMDEILVLKGADILPYGSNAAFGAIQYITRKPQVVPQLNAQITTGQRNYQSQYITYGGTWNKVGAELQLLHKTFDGFQDNSGFTLYNITSKVFAELSPRTSAYLKLNYHEEHADASYSGLTPFTFAADPTQNPFDADDLTTRRMAADLIVTTRLSDAVTLESKVYAHRFARDWWRQEGTVIRASDAANYLGESILEERYNYMSGLTFGADDYVRVGKIASGRESTRARNREFNVAGLQETLKVTWETGAAGHELQVSARVHSETFSNQEFLADSSRFARSGRLVLDEYFTLNSLSGFVANTTTWNKLRVTPIVRFEAISMSSYNQMAIAADPNHDGSAKYGAKQNQFSQVIPGISLALEVVNNEAHQAQVYGGVFKGYLAPSTDVGFLVIEDDVVSAPAAGEEPNMVPQTSINAELGVRGSLFREIVTASAAVYQNHLNNYYAAGRTSAFQSVGQVNISGVEMSAALHLHRMVNLRGHEISVTAGGSLLQAEILGGKLNDSDILKAKHTDETKTEIIDKINENRDGYEIFFASSGGSDSLVTRQLTVEDFSSIKRINLDYSQGGFDIYTLPYLPSGTWNFGLAYSYHRFTVGANLNMVSEQYTDFMNLEHETADGGIGRLDAFRTVDVNVAYEFKTGKSNSLRRCSVFLTGKNITDEVYKASRLHRVSSGIMPGGFRQINAGVRFTI